MNIRENYLAIFNYENFDAVPLAHFGFWTETITKWYLEGHITDKDVDGKLDKNGEVRMDGDQNMKFLWLQDVMDLTAKKVGFDFSVTDMYNCPSGLFPAFEPKLIKVDKDGTEYRFDRNGVTIMTKPTNQAIPAEVDHTLIDRESWEKEFKPRLQWSDDRLDVEAVKKFGESIKNRTTPYGIKPGSLAGDIRDWMGLEGFSYLYADDYELYEEIIDTVGNLCYDATKAVLDIYDDFDYMHFWEDICFKNGPLVIPKVFDKLWGPHYKRITDLGRQHGIKLCNLDCDGVIDSLIPTWLNNGVNMMFPIEVGVWGASIAPWREKYGKELRGLGGMDKRVFAKDKKAVEAEVERLHRLIDLGGYIPCPDHRIPVDAKYDNVRYYCDLMHNLKI